MEIRFDSPESNEDDSECIMGKSDMVQQRTLIIDFGDSNDVCHEGLPRASLRISGRRSGNMG